MTIKFFFHYPAVDPSVLEEKPREEKNMARKVYDDFLAPAVDGANGRRQELMGAKFLAFLPQVTNVTSGDDFSKRYFWESDNTRIFR